MTHTVFFLFFFVFRFCSDLYRFSPTGLMPPHPGLASHALASHALVSSAPKADHSTLDHNHRFVATYHPVALSQFSYRWRHLNTRRQSPRHRLFPPGPGIRYPSPFAPSPVPLCAAVKRAAGWWQSGRDERVPLDDRKVPSLSNISTAKISRRRIGGRAPDLTI